MRSLHEKLALVSLLIFILLPLGQEPFAEEMYFLHSKGFGPVSIGMTPSMASSVFGVPVRPAGVLDEDDVYCHYEFTEGNYKKVGFMVQEGIISRIDIWDPGYQTDTGITVGQKESVIIDKYQGKVSEKIHPYLGKAGKYIVVNNSDGYQMVFETDSGVVTRFRTGKTPSVEYIEGCL